MCETWKPIPGYEGYYEASNKGRIRSLERMIKSNYGSVRAWPERIMSQTPQSAGYLICTLSKRGESSQHLIHKLVTSAFLGECPDGYVIHHRNHNRQDNRVKNLEFQEASSHGAMHALEIVSAKGSANAHSKLTEEDVIRIRELYSTGNVLQRQLARQYEVDDSVISRVITRQAWRHI